MFIDGFGFGVLGDFLSQSSFDVSSVYVGTGIWLRGQSVNNVVLGSSQIVGADSTQTQAAPMSAAIRLGDLTQPQPEGFVVQPGTLIFGFKRGLWVQGAINVTMTGAICDGMSEYGALEESDDRAPSFGNNYTDNYLGISGTCRSAFHLRSTATAYREDNRGTTLRNNEIGVYAGASLDHGYYVEGSFIENISIVDSKLIRGRDAGGGLIETRIRDCKVTGGRGHRIRGNAWNSTTGFETGVPVQYEGNAGRLAVGHELVFRYEGGQRVSYGDRPPSTGAGAVGDRCINTRPRAGDAFSWICVAAGTPGTWKSLGEVAL